MGARDLARRGAALLAAGLLLAACGTTPSPRPSGSDFPSDPDVDPSRPAVVATVAPDLLAGDWRAEPLPLGDAQVATISDACAASARSNLGDDEADLPTAVVDARGVGRFLAVLADDELAILCLGRIDAANAATVDSVDRLAAESFGRPDGDNDATVTEMTPEELGGGQRILAVGRLGVAAARATVSLRDGSSVTTSAGNGWWAAWWPAPTPAGQVATADASGKALAATDVPAGIVESRLGAASWWLDPQAPAPTASSTSLDVLVLEISCSGARSGVDRLDPPQIDVTADAFVIRMGIRRVPGASDCPGNTPFPAKIDLPEAVGGRSLLDGSERPPRDAARPPSG